MTDFPDRNLDFLHARVSSGEADPEKRESKLAEMIRLLAESGNGSLSLILKKSGEWLAVLTFRQDAASGTGDTAMEAMDRALASMADPF